MKSLNDVLKLDMQDLERIAQDKTVMVPPTLKRDIAVTARALEMASAQESAQRASTLRKRYTLASCSAAAVAIIAAVLSLTPDSSPQDTFNDPMMAYAQMEQVMGYISEKMNAGLDIASQAGPAIEKTINALK